MISKGLCSIFVGILAVFTATARDAIEVESSYLGAGWFEYRVRTLADPFFKKITLGQLAPWPFTNYVESIPPAHWTNFLDSSDWWGIKPDGTQAQPRIQEVIFRAKSSFTTFRRRQYGFTTVLGIQMADPYEGGVGGYVSTDCLIPCSPEEADGSATNMVSGIELIPDIKIDELIHTNGEIHGLTFSWYQQSTVQLEASHDMNLWTPVARFFGDPPQSNWTTNGALNPYGNFFRLSLIANRHFTNGLSGATFAIRSLVASDIPIQNQEILDKKIKIGFASIPDTRYQVTRDQWSGQIQTVQQVTAIGSFTSVTFDLIDSQRGGLFRVQQLSK